MKEQRNFIDLGLPSGTLWDANPIFGYCLPDYARRLYERSLPTREQFEELFKYCLISRPSGCYINFQGPNGNSICLTTGGYWQKYLHKVSDVGVGYYWLRGSKLKLSRRYRMAFGAFNSKSGYFYTSETFRPGYGFRIRLVKQGKKA